MNPATLCKFRKVVFGFSELDEISLFSVHQFYKFRHSTKLNAFVSLLLLGIFNTIEVILNVKITNKVDKKWRKNKFWRPKMFSSSSNPI